MNPALKVFQTYIFAPLHRFRQNFFSRNAAGNFFGVITDFVFDCSKETALIMLFFNAVSIISSHIAQIGGLRKSKRDNKDYLINQEKQELLIDLVLTIIPPFILNNFLKKKFESGTLTTREAREKLINVVAPVVGVSRDELYSTEHLRPIKETVASLIAKVSELILKKNKNLPIKLESNLRSINKKAKALLPDSVTRLPFVTLEDIACDFDNLAKEKRISNGILKKFRNGSAYDDLCGQNNGLLILATIGYSILASNIIMPILKNKLSNRAYEKQLAQMGETRESIKRKKRYEFNNVPILNSSDSKLFEVFSNYDHSTFENKQNCISAPQKVSQLKSEKRTFDSFDPYSKIVTQSSGLRI